MKKCFHPPFTAPQSYREWLEYMECLGCSSRADQDLITAVSQGAFDGSGQMLKSFKEQLIRTLTSMLERRIKRFGRELNGCLDSHETENLSLLFRRFRSAVHQCFFFDSLLFLEEAFKEELRRSLKEQIQRFWYATIDSLQNQYDENPYANLGDSLYLIGKIKLFRVPA